MFSNRHAYWRLRALDAAAFSRGVDDGFVQKPKTNDGTSPTRLGWATVSLPVTNVNYSPDEHYRGTRRILRRRGTRQGRGQVLPTGAPDHNLFANIGRSFGRLTDNIGHIITTVHYCLYDASGALFIGV